MLNSSTLCVVFSVTYYLELLKATFLLIIQNFPQVEPFMFYDVKTTYLTLFGERNLSIFIPKCYSIT